MTSSHHETLVVAKLDMPSERSTGFVFAVVCLIAALVFRGNEAVFWALIVGALEFGVVAALWPIALKPLNIAWFKLSQLLSKIVSPVVMFVLFVAVIVPCGLIMQCFRDPLAKQRTQGQTSYWIMRGDDAQSSTMRDQF